MDADDLVLGPRFGNQLTYLRAHPEVAAVGTRVRLFPERAVGEGMKRFVAWQNSLLTPEDHARELFVESPLCHPSVMLRRAALDAVGGWRTVPWAEDYDLWLRVTARHPVHFIERPLIVKRGGHADQLSRAFWGMDRFRVYALLKMLRKNDPPRAWRLLTAEELRKKCRILIQGFEKRGKERDAALYREILNGSYDSPEPPFPRPVSSVN
jgi:hypothetical protein